MDLLETISAEHILCHTESYEIGHGSFGVVARGFHKNHGHAAIKCFVVSGGERQQLMVARKILTEYNMLEQAGHQNIIPVYGIVKWSGCMGIVMEYCTGGNLACLLLDKYIPVGLSLILRINTEIASAVAYIHNLLINGRMVHGDLKPENVLLTLMLTCKICDFGCAQLANYTGSTSTTGRQHSEPLALTVYYAAPEKLLHNARPKKEQDTFSCGVMQHTTLSREYPYQTDFNFIENLRQGVRPNCEAIDELKEECSESDREIIEVIEDEMKRCWNQDPAQRPSMSDVRDRFQLLLNRQNPAIIAQQVACAVVEMRIQHPPQNPTVPLDHFQFDAQTGKLAIFRREAIDPVEEPGSENMEVQPQEALQSEVVVAIVPEEMPPSANAEIQSQELRSQAVVGPEAVIPVPEALQDQANVVAVVPCFLVIGGWNSERDCMKYDVTTGENEQFQSLNLSRCGATSVAAANTIVVLGGSATWSEPAAHRSCEVCDTHENIPQWNSLPDMLVPRKWCGSGYLAGHIFVTGGRNGHDIFSSCEKLADGGDAWMAIPNLLHARYAHGTVVCKGSLYCIGGRGRSERLSSCERFDLRRENWNYIPILNKARSEVACVEMGGCIYAIGGFNDDDGCLDSVERYNPERNNWEYVASLRSPRSHSCACVVQDKIYVIGGSCNGRHLRSVEVYDPVLNSWTTVFEMVKPAWMATSVAV